MRINSLYNNYIGNNYAAKPSGTSFGSNNRFYYTTKGREIGTVSSMFREDLDWARFTQYLNDNFKDKEKVNVVQYAASDGSEAYTLLIALQKNNENTFTKFLPIKAYDLDKEVVKAAQSGLVNLKDSDFLRMKCSVKNTEKYFEKAEKKLEIPGEVRWYPISYTETYKASDDLKNNVQFNQGDMFELVNDIDDRSNTVVLCRNVLSYWKADKVSDFLENLSQQLKTGSLVVTGNLDTANGGVVPYFLQKYGFEYIMPNVYRKL